MSYQIVFESTQDFCEGLKALPFTLKGSLYKNVFPQNCLYYQGNGIYSADCWNLIKAYIWGKGVLPKNKGGYWFNPGRYGLGDWNGKQILNACFDVSSNFYNLTPGEYLLTEKEDHAAIYVGDFTGTLGGKQGTWNVIECTPIWANGIQATYVDEQGRRLQAKGGQQAGSWKYHGKLPWVNYKKTEIPPQQVILKDQKMVIKENTGKRIVIELQEA